MKMHKKDETNAAPAPQTAGERPPCGRREFLCRSLPGSVVLLSGLGACAPSEDQDLVQTEAPAPDASATEHPTDSTSPNAEAEAGSAAYDASEHMYAMGVDPNLCIGCGRCADACKTENDVPREPFYFRTWIERYVVPRSGPTVVSSPNGGIEGFPPEEVADILRTFFVPKLCNQCDNAPCVQVCPVGATFITEDGVVLVDHDYCIGCRYCIQACPYGARFLHPVTRTAEKCTFCYHRLVKGLSPACVENCPTQARIFGELGPRSSPLARFQRLHKIRTLKPHLNTNPKVYYADLDGEVS